MIDIDQRFSELSPVKQALLKARVNRRTKAAQCARTIPRQPSRDDAPLSFAQERIWLHEQLSPGSVVYHRPANIRLRGPLQIDSLGRALAEIVERHDSLRSRVQWTDGPPKVRVDEGSPFELPFTDLSGELIPDERARSLASTEAMRTFDLQQGPLLRARLIRLGLDDYLLSLTFHHFTFDAWSHAVFLEELATAYERCVENATCPPEMLTIQYPDFATWDRSDERIATLQAGRDYWSQELSAPPTLTLPTDCSRSSAASEDAGFVDLELPSELVESLRALAAEEQTTLFSVLLAAFTTLLHRYSGDNDIVVGCPVACRNRVETERLIGTFINTLPLRTRLEAEDAFRQILLRVRDSVIQGLHHQDVPLQWMAADVLANRVASPSPLFQAMFVFEHLPAQPRTAAGVLFAPDDTGPAATIVDLTLELMESSIAVAGRLVYRSALWERATIERMASHFVGLLHGIVANPEQRIGELPLMTDAERRQVLVDWSGRTANFPVSKCLHELFEEQVDRTPDAVAVTFEDGRLTYQELDDSANRLAQRLRQLGVGPETKVGLCLERSRELVVGILGILKAGGAYVPLDPKYPEERLRFAVSDAAIHVLVTQPGVVSQEVASNVPVVYLEIGDSKSSTTPLGRVASGARPEHAAYVIYTSGSTGTPKGVVVTHANVVRLLEATQAWYHFDSNDVWTLFHSAAFDFSVWELWGALRYGGRLVVVPYIVSRSPEDFYRLLHREKVTVLNQTPSAFHQLCSAEEAMTDRPALALRTIIFGGEALDLRSLGPWFDRHGDRSPQLVNMYGITETTVHVTHRPIRMADVAANVGSRIGHPIPDLAVYVLDRFRQPVPIGLPGELYVGGAGLARGYLNRPELTAERFCENPFDQRSEERLYKTGDRVRWCANGELEYLGRLDEQIKLRGHRIELGEIEAALAEHRKVSQAVVVVREDSPGDKRLVAYVVLRNVATMQPDQFRDYLKQKLPDYMIPATFVVRSHLPLTPSGKIDRRALPAPCECPTEGVHSTVAARTPNETLLVEIWEDVLKRKPIGIHDNFFDIGGHSLLATMTAAKVRQKLNIELPIQVLFSKPTIEGLASYLLEQQAETAGGDHTRSLLDMLDAMSETEATDLTLQPVGDLSSVREGNAPQTGQPIELDFHCPSKPSKWFGLRKCNLVIMIHEQLESDNFEKVAHYVREWDPCIEVAVVRDVASTGLALALRPTMVFSPTMIRHPLPIGGRTYCGFPMSKSEEYEVLAKAGIAVPQWIVLKEGVNPDLSGFGDYVVRKPDLGGLGAEVCIVKKTRVRWKPLAVQAIGTQSDPLIQEFIYTGLWPISYRVNTLFGKVLYAVKQEGNNEHPPLPGPRDFQNATGYLPIVATARGSKAQPCYESDVIQFGETAHAAFPNIPLLGFDIVREVPSGKLYVLEANAVGFIWKFYSRQPAEYGFSFEEQFDGLRKAAFILAEKTQQCAC